MRERESSFFYFRSEGLRDVELVLTFPAFFFIVSIQQDPAMKEKSPLETTA